MLWSLGTVSLAMTIAWTVLFHVRLVRKDQGYLNRCFVITFASTFAVLMLLFGTILILGFQGTGPATVVMALMVPMMLLTTWLFHAAIVVSFHGRPQLQDAVKSASMELPLFNVLVACNLEGEEEVERLQKDRDPLEKGLRLFEDIPELTLGFVDIFFFKWSWFAFASLAMSFVMTAVMAALACFERLV